MTMNVLVSRRTRLSGCSLAVLGAWMCIGTAHAGTWQPVGVGDCSGRDVAGSRGPIPEAGKCDASFAGYTAVCWANGCTYKSLATGSCTGGANPGQMYTCAAAAPMPAGGGWQAVGMGDCPGRDVAGTSGPNPDPTKCNASFAGGTAVCWATGCTYKNVATPSCTGGANPGQMYTCSAHAAPPPVGAGWQAVGIGDCPGRDVAGTSGPSPDATKCNTSFAGSTAVCWTTGCTYKNVPTASCTGGANPGQMYSCSSYAAPAPPSLSPAPPPSPLPPPAGDRHLRRGPEKSIAGAWQSVGVGDCPGRDVAGTSGPTPDPSKCDSNFAGNTAVCWATGCTYKNVTTGLCVGGANPGQLYTCAASVAPPPPPASPKLQGKRYSVINYTGDTQNPHDFIVDWKSCKVAELSQESDLGTEDISVLICRPGSRLIIRTDFRTTGSSIQYDWVVLDKGATLAGSYRDPTTCGPSAGKRGK